MDVGEKVILVDGKGGWYEAVIEEAHPKRCKLQINSHVLEFQPLTYTLHLAISPTKSMDRFEWFLEKATEIGITEITPLICHRTERKQVKLERWERILVSAMKQSLKAYLPTLNPPVTLSKFVGKDHPGTKGISHCIPTDRQKLTSMKRTGSYTFLVGPEGDFTDEEVKMAIEKGFEPYTLGSSRLRTETAGVYLCTAISLLSSSPTPDQSPPPKDGI